MATTTGTATTFSHCSIESANQYLGSTTAKCMYNIAGRQSPIQRGDTSWLAGSWSDCSVTCGQGLKVRPVECRESNGALRPKVDCNQFTKPSGVMPCNATASCDGCTSYNCSGVGICRDGRCWCPQGTTGLHCEIPVISTKSEMKPSPAEERVAASQMALVLTGALTGVALAMASLLWICRFIGRRRNGGNEDHIKLTSSASGGIGGGGGDGVIHRSSDNLSTNLKPSSSQEDPLNAAPTAPMAGSAMQHKTPRSTPRTLFVR